MEWKNLFITHVRINQTIWMNEIDNQIEQDKEQIKTNARNIKKNTDDIFQERKEQIAGNQANDEKDRKIKQLRNEEDSQLFKIWESIKAFWNVVAH